VTLTQLALVAGVATVLAGWCLRRALQFGPATVAATYRRLYSTRASTITQAAVSRWDRSFVRLGARLANSEIGQRVEARRRYAFRAGGVSVPLLATRVVSAAVLGFVAGLVLILLPTMTGTAVAWPILTIVPFGVAVLMGWYQLSTVVAVADRRYRAFRAGVAAYVQLVAVCMTTRRSMTEAISYAAEVGTGPAFDTIAAAVHAAPQMGIRVWEALDSVGVEYDCRELQDLASSVGHVARIGVGVETTVTAVATRMRQVALDDMQRSADRQTSTMFGPTLLFVAGVVAFLGYPLIIRVFDAFSTTS
jgi:hypothetical protein